MPPKNYGTTMPAPRASKPRETNNSRSSSLEAETAFRTKATSKPTTSSPLATPSSVNSPRAHGTPIPVGMAAPIMGSAIPAEGAKGRMGKVLTPVAEREELEEESVQTPATTSDSLSELNVEGLLRSDMSPRSDNTVHGKGRESLDTRLPDPYTSEMRSVFQGILYLDDSPIPIEPLFMTLAHAYPPFNAEVDEDPLVDFGGVNGLLPGRTEYESNTVRNVLIRMSVPPKNCLWSTLATAVEDFTSHKFSLDELIQHNESNSPSVYYSLHKELLLEVAHIVVALSQVLDGWADFFYMGKGVSFEVDPGYKMIRILAWHDKPLNIILTGGILQ